MTRGRKPKPHELKIAEGAHIKNPQRFKHEVPSTSANEPIMPEGLTEEAQKEWQRIEVLLRAAGMWTATYQTTIELYCETYASYLHARDQVRKSGIALLSRDANGKAEVRRNPFSVELHKYKEETLRLLVELGMTPSSRSRIALNSDDDADDAFAQLLA